MRLLKKGRESTQNEQCNGWPSHARNGNSVTAVHAIISADVLVTIDKMLLKLRTEHFTEVSKGSVYTIRHPEIVIAWFVHVRSGYCWPRDTKHSEWVQRSLFLLIISLTGSIFSRVSWSVMNLGFISMKHKVKYNQWFGDQAVIHCLKKYSKSDPQVWSIWGCSGILRALFTMNTFRRGWRDERRLIRQNLNQSPKND